MKQIHDDLWIVDMPFKYLAADMGNRMTIIRLKNNLLLLHSPIEYSADLGRSLEPLGEVRYLISPNRFHDLYIEKWQIEYPQALHYSLRKKFGLHKYLDEIAEVSDIVEDLIVLPIQGIPKVEEYAFYHLPSRSLILTDLAFNIPRNVSTWSKLFFTLHGTLDRFGPSRVMRSLIKEPDKFQYSLQQMLNWNFERIILSHGNIIENNAKSIFTKGFSDFLKHKTGMAMD